MLGCGGYLPERIVTNDELAQRLDTSDEWIVQRTGIRQRHVAADGRVHLRPRDLRAPSARSRPRAWRAAELDLIVLATATPDHTFPATATQGAGAARHAGAAPAFDVQAVCTGFVYALAIADNFLRARPGEDARW